MLKLFFFIALKERHEQNVTLEQLCADCEGSMSRICPCCWPVVQQVGTLSSWMLEEQCWKAQKARYARRAVVCVGDR